MTPSSNSANLCHRQLYFEAAKSPQSSLEPKAVNKIECGGEDSAKIINNNNNVVATTTKLEILDDSHIQRLVNNVTLATSNNNATFQEQQKHWSSNFASSNGAMWPSSTTLSISAAALSPKLSSSQQQLLSPRNYILSCATSSNATVSSIMGYTSPIATTSIATASAQQLEINTVGGTTAFNGIALQPICKTDLLLSPKLQKHLTPLGSPNFLTTSNQMHSSPICDSLNVTISSNTTTATTTPTFGAFSEKQPRMHSILDYGNKY